MGKENLTIVTPRPHWNVQDIGYDFEPVTTEEVNRLVRDIDIGKDSCIEGVSSSILKDSFLLLSDHLQYLFNVSFQERIFPHEWAKGPI